MVRIHPDPPTAFARRVGARGARAASDRGAVAQLGEHLLCKQGVVGSIPISSTSVPQGRGKGSAKRAGKVCARFALVFAASSDIGCSLTIGQK